MRAIPVIYVHWGNSDYLKYTFRQTKYFNSDSRIIFLGDETNNKYKEVEHYNILDYSKSADAFDKIYKHLCFLSQYYVLFWFKRWFIIKDFLETRKDIDDFLYVDSDVLLFCNVSEVFSRYKHYSLSLNGERGPQYTYFNSKDSLNDFCNFVTRLYTEPALFSNLIEKYRTHQIHSLPGGVDDMHAFYEYRTQTKKEIGDTAQEMNETVFDGCFNVSEGYEFDNSSQTKQIYWKNEIPYVFNIKKEKILRLNAIHFQGPSKKLMHKFYSGKDLFLAKIISDYHYNILLPIKTMYGKYLTTHNDK